MKVLSSLLLAIVLPLAVLCQTPSTLAHTYSIVAYDSATGDMGVAVQSHWFSVGSIVIWGEAGVGAIATQSFVNPAFGPDGLALLRQGLSAQETIEKLIEKDAGSDFRQVGIIDAAGNAAAFTGEKCIAEAGHLVSKGYAVQANMMLNTKVCSAMAAAFEDKEGLPLGERLLAALEAAQKVGGDIRGQQSAAILIVAAKNTGKPWIDRKVDLRVEDHPTPIAELKRLFTLKQAYDFMNQGDLEMEHGNIEGALKAYAIANEICPENTEMKFWRAVNLANLGRMKEALPLFTEVFTDNEQWRQLTERIVAPGLLTVSQDALQQILKLKVDKQPKK